MNLNKYTSSPNKKLILYRYLAIGIPAIFLITAAATSKITATKIKTQTTIAEEIMTKTADYEEATSFSDFLNNNKINLEKMNLSIPAESMVVGVVQDVEYLIRRIDPNSLVKFSSSTPARVGQDLVIPMSITINSQLGQIPELIEEIVNLPYLIQIISTESQITNDFGTTQITLRLYVQEPFAGY